MQANSAAKAVKERIPLSASAGASESQNDPSNGQNPSGSASSICFYNLRGRLAQFRPIGEHRLHWEERWTPLAISAAMETAATGKLDEFENLFTKYLPRDLPILEAGCGKGHLVKALTSRGYFAEGVDYGANTIDLIREIAPELKVRVGDVYNLDVPDGTYGGYISIGILEHNAEGPQSGLHEVRRVLDPRGVALISVPYLNNHRHILLSKVPSVEETILSDGVKFYQYYYSRVDFERYLINAGLEVVAIWPYAVYAGLTRDFESGKWLHRRQFFHWRIHRRITQLCREAPEWISSRWAHMIMFVCKKAHDS